MAKRFHLTLTATFLLLYLASIVSPSVWAATANPQNAGQALEIAPPVVTLTVSPGQTLTTQIYLRDIAATNLNVSGQANDFVAAGEDGTPKVLLDPNETSPYSMKSWVQALPSLTLIPREIKAMNVTIKVPQNASPGGHYGVIRFTATPPNLGSTGVALSASLGALLLVTVTGNIKESVSVQQFSVSQNGHSSSLFENAPIDFEELFKNSGNVHEQPVGEVTVSDMLGHKLAVLTVNTPPHNVLPNSLRKFEQSLDRTVIGNKFMIGRYTADLKVTYGSSKKTLTSQLTFWVIPYRLIAAVVIAAIVGFFGLRFLIRRYNHHIIAKSQRTRRR